LVTSIKKLDNSFYDRPDVVKIARELLGKVLVTEFDGQRTSGRIVETEAYNGVTDRASHAWSGRRTARTEVMYARGGRAYVYLIYGIHHLFNVVTNIEDTPNAVLVRGLEPLEGIPVMLGRTGKTKLDHTLTRGPGNLSRALGLLTLHTGMSLLEDVLLEDVLPGDTLLGGNVPRGEAPGKGDVFREDARRGKDAIYIADDGFRLKKTDIGVGPRIGVDYAGEDAALPYRFFVKGNVYVSGKKSLNEL
jgi:DNA-3-methyladenine glycosylase